jgi:hypothetical protein
MLLDLTVRARVSDEALARIPELMESGDRLVLCVIQGHEADGHGPVRLPERIAEGVLVGAVESHAGAH